jgi:uncharacterized protein YcbK (DUF882 family)
MFVRGPLRLVVLRGDGRPSREIALRACVLNAALWLTLLLPFSTGALLGARHASAQRSAPWLCELGALAHDASPRLQSDATNRCAPYVLLARSELAVAPYAPPPAPVLDRELKTPAQRRGHLRIASLHHGEAIDVVPWNEHGMRDEAAFAAIAHLFRCRVTGHEMPVDEKLIKVLTTLNDLYDKPLQLISGHRVAHTLDTSETSQHTLGTAADVRVPGVSIDELREVALGLGARGVGLYTHKRFVHIDFRAQRKYQWTDASTGEESEPAAATANAEAARSTWPADERFAQGR